MSADYSAVPLGIAPGTPFGGGFFAGFISHTADGNPTHALIVAPRATGATGGSYALTTSLAWKTANTTTTNTTSIFDGAANTAAMVTAGIADHPAAQFCVNLNIGDYTDWYLPARREMDIAYFNLKPSSATNDVSSGANDYSVPKRTANYTLAYPAQTTVTAFTTSAEQFTIENHWTSTEASSAAAWRMFFGDGSQSNGSGKGSLLRVRAFRRITL
jgi:hypothetical protein